MGVWRGIRLFALWLGLCLSASAVCAEAGKARADWLTRPFDPTGDVLPRRFLGHDLMAIHGAAPAVPPRDQFQTEAERAAGQAAFEAKPFIGSIALSSVLAFRFEQSEGGHGLKVAYDADKETVKLEFESRELSWLPLSHWVGMFATYTSRGRRPGVTAMGVRFTYEAVELGYAGLSLPAHYYVTSEVMIPREDARHLVPNVSALLVGRLTAPYRTTERRREAARVSDPRDRSITIFMLAFVPQEVWFFDRRTGRVLSKARRE